MVFEVKAMKPGAGITLLVIDAADPGEAARQAVSQGLTRQDCFHDCWWGPEGSRG